MKKFKCKIDRVTCKRLDRKGRHVVEYVNDEGVEFIAVTTVNGVFPEFPEPEQRIIERAKVYANEVYRIFEKVEQERRRDNSLVNMQRVMVAEEEFTLLSRSTLVEQFKSMPNPFDKVAFKVAAGDWTIYGEVHVSRFLDKVGVNRVEITHCELPLILGDVSFEYTKNGTLKNKHVSFTRRPTTTVSVTVKKK